MKRINRRMVLRGACGVAFALPLLESFAPKRARAQSAVEDDTFAIFFRQANGCAQGGTTGELGPEPSVPRE